MRNIALLAALAFASSFARAEDGTRWVTPDFFVRESRVPLSFPTPAPADCRAHIAAAVCVVPPKDDRSGRSCLPGDAYAATFLALYDAYPPRLKETFCRVNHIQIEPDFAGSAYGGLDRDDRGNVLGAVLGIRKSILDERLPLARWASWKEQLPFGGPRNAYDPRPDLPNVEASIAGVNDLLYFVFAHEFGHILDFSENLNQSGWRALSWKSENVTRFDAAFPLRSKLEFYGERPRLPGGAADAVYEQLGRTNFVGLYAATNPYDDLAETVAHYALLTRGGTYAVRLPSGRALEAARRFLSPALAAKRAYVERLLNPAPARPEAPARPPRPLPIPPLPGWD